MLKKLTKEQVGQVDWWFDYMWKVIEEASRD